MPWDIICDEIKQNYMKNMFAKISKKVLSLKECSK